MEKRKITTVLRMRGVKGRFNGENLSIFDNGALDNCSMQRLEENGETFNSNFQNGIG